MSKLTAATHSGSKSEAQRSLLVKMSRSSSSLTLTVESGSNMPGRLLQICELWLISTLQSLKAVYRLQTPVAMARVSLGSRAVLPANVVSQRSYTMISFAGS